MGRRDEPKLDELKRLLRRLETMEAEPGSGGATKSAPEPRTQGSGYIGALRGAAPIAAEDRPYAPQTSREPTIGFKGSTPASAEPRSSSTASIVIGATTAAVVSSLVAVGLLLWAGGGRGDKAAGQQQLNFTPTKQGGEHGTGAGDEAGKKTDAPAEAQSLLQRADLHIRNGDLSEARQLLEKAAKLGSGVAALTLGAMYDPVRVAEFGNLGVKADPTLARAWYERARALGIVEANDRLSELARK